MNNTEAHGYQSAWKRWKRESRPFRRSWVASPHKLEISRQHSRGLHQAHVAKSAAPQDLKEPARIHWLPTKPEPLHVLFLYVIGQRKNNDSDSLHKSQHVFLHSQQNIVKRYLLNKHRKDSPVEILDCMYTWPKTTPSLLRFGPTHSAYIRRKPRGRFFLEHWNPLLRTA